jgi:hypothetical protein
MSLPNLISYETYLLHKTKRQKKKFLYVNDIKYTLDKLHILPKKEQKGMKKKELEESLLNFFDALYKYSKNLDKIILLQRKFKKYLENKNKAIYGDVLKDKSKSHNDTDFYTFTPIDEIHKEYLFSYTDENNFIYSFDIRSFYKLLETTKENPYNREQIPEFAIESFTKRIEYIRNNNIYIEQFEEDKLTPNQIFNNRVFKIFQTIDLLNTTAGGTNTQWFHNLDIHQLKNYYKVFEDVWNYRAELTPQQKEEIVGDTVMFPINVSKVCSLYDKRKIQNIILKEMEKLLFKPQSDIHRGTASYYILIAFVEISSECAQAMPWLIQY